MKEELIQKYDLAVSHLGLFERKGKTMPYTSANGYMFSFFNKDGEFGIRLPKSIAKDFKEQYKTGDFYSHGAKMKDYVNVPLALFEDQDLICEYLKMGFEYVMSLKPK